MLPPKVSHFPLLDPYLSLHDLQEILSIRALAILFRALCEGRLIDPAVHVGDLLRHGDVDAGASLYGADEFSGFVKGVHRAGIEPSVAAPQDDYIQISFLEIDLIEICDLKLTSRGGLHLFRVFADILIVEIETCHGVVRFRMGRLLLDGLGTAFFIEVDNAEALRIVDVVAKNSGPFRAGVGFFQVLCEACTVEDVIPQYHRAGLPIDELFSQDEGLREAVWKRLNLVGEVDAIARSVPQKSFKVWQILRGRDDEDILDPRQHEGGKRIEDHRFVINGKQLLRSDHSQRIEPCVGTSS